MNGTFPALDAEFVEAGRELTGLAVVNVASVGNTLLVFDAETDPVHRAELYRVAVGDARSQHRIANATIRPKGNGYMLALPGGEAAGFREGDAAPVRSASGLLIITSDDHRYVRRGEDLEASWREMQR